MKLRSLTVTGLLGSSAPLELKFNPDLNIITGINGSGKTTILKLIWYIVSGNIGLALKDVGFSTATVDTTLYSCTVRRLASDKCEIELLIPGKEPILVKDLIENGKYTKAHELVSPFLSKHGTSKFFPTFRRLEGGFTLGDSATRFLGIGSNIAEDLDNVSKRLSNSNHTFIITLSTNDIVAVVTSEHSRLNEMLLEANRKMIAHIGSQLQTFNSDLSKSDSELRLVASDIQKQMAASELTARAIMAPFDGLRTLVKKLFRHAGITVGSEMTFGEAAAAISSESLSSGEKQMLSFIAHNAFTNEAMIIIDEPELSLHVDWQRQFFPILQSQQTSNQFVVATHSPFIYSKYPDSEIRLNPTRGDEQA